MENLQTTQRFINAQDELNRLIDARDTKRQELHRVAQRIAEEQINADLKQEFGDLTERWHAALVEAAQNGMVLVHWAAHPKVSITTNPPLNPTGIRGVLEIRDNDTVFIKPHYHNMVPEIGEVFIRIKGGVLAGTHGHRLQPLGQLQAADFIDFDYFANYMNRLPTGWYPEGVRPARAWDELKMAVAAMMER